MTVEDLIKALAGADPRAVVLVKEDWNGLHQEIKQVEIIRSDSFRRVDTKSGPYYARGDGRIPAVLIG